MRRTALLLLTAFFPLLSIQVNAQTKKGDLNGDGNVGKEDVTCLIYKILGLAEGNDAYDVNEDGKTDIADVTCLIGIIASNQQGMPFQTCPDDHHPHMIDLGLPSGVKWACCNVGASKPENYGGYYAWGETEVKNDYSFETYIHCDGTQETCHYLGNITGTAYDVAHVKWGEAWRMPTIAERDELIRNCSVETITLYDKFFDKYTGPNGSFIIIPYGGNMYSSINLHEGSDVHSWTSEQQENGQTAHYLYKNGLIGSCLTCMGLTVRPVYDPSFFLLSDETVDIFVNSAASVTIEGGSGEYELQYDQTDIIDAELIMADKEEDPDAKDEISIFGVAEGTATLLVLDKVNNKTATLVVNVKTLTEEDIANTKEYITRVGSFINIQGEFTVDAFQSNLLSWLGDQDYVKQVNLSSDKSMITITFENGINFIISFQDTSFFYDFEDNQNSRLFTPMRAEAEENNCFNVSYQVGEQIVLNKKILYIQGRTMVEPKGIQESTAKQELSCINQIISGTPIKFDKNDITIEKNNLSFLDPYLNKNNNNPPQYGMIIISQTHGWENLKGAFQIEDVEAWNNWENTNYLDNRGYNIYVNNKNIEKIENKPGIFWIKPELGRIISKNAPIIYAGFCYSSGIKQVSNSFFGYRSHGIYELNTECLIKFIENIKNGMTVKDATENLAYFFKEDFNRHRISIAKTNKKHRYFSISIDEVTEQPWRLNPIIKGHIEGYNNIGIKFGSDYDYIYYYIYDKDKDKEFNPADIFANNKNKKKAKDNGEFEYEYDLPYYVVEKELLVRVGFRNGDKIYYSNAVPIKRGLCPNDRHPHTIDLGIGVKWSCCNLGANSPEEIGDLFAWGETEAKEECTICNYKYKHIRNEDDINSAVSYVICDGVSYVMDYLSNSISGTDKDAAHKIRKGGWHMPTLDEINLLYNSCTLGGGNINGVDYSIIIGPNGKRILVPSATWAGTLYTDGTVNNVGFAYIFEPGFNYWWWRRPVYGGLPVRPVIK